MFSFKNHTENKTGRLIPDLILSLKSFIWGKSKWFAAYFQYILITPNLAYTKNNLCKTLDY